MCKFPVYSPTMMMKKRKFGELDTESVDLKKRSRHQGPSMASSHHQSHYFPYFLQYQKDFCKLGYFPYSSQFSHQASLLDRKSGTPFENQGDELNYVAMRIRESKFDPHDYIDHYFSAAEFGDLVLDQRFLMISWMVKEKFQRNLEYETLFLGVSLFDRFLSQGYFNSKTGLQLLGVACLTLAARIEETQSSNCLSYQHRYQVEENHYSRSEVIGMEWMVQKILKFHCLVPTAYNFLWFYLKEIKADVGIEKRVIELSVRSLLDHGRLSFFPSTLAAGLVMLVSNASKNKSSCLRVKETHQNKDLLYCVQSLEEWIQLYGITNI